MGDYDRGRPLVIDPMLISYAGYIGGAGGEEGHGIAVDQDGAAYVIGTTDSDQSSFPVTGGPDLTVNGNKDAFVAEVKPDGSGLVYAGYIGGASEDRGYGIAVDQAGAAYVTGVTDSDQASFPVSVGPGLTYSRNYDAFVAKVEPGGRGLVYAGYIGGAGFDEGVGIAVDQDGAAYVAGDTESDQAGFPVTGGPDLTPNGGWDAFVAKVEPGGRGLVYAGYIGGAGTEWGSASPWIRRGGLCYGLHRLRSNQLPGKRWAGPDLQRGWADAFVAKVEPDGSGLV